MKRPTPEQVETVQTLREAGNTEAEILSALGISKSEFTKWLARGWIPYRTQALSSIPPESRPNSPSHQAERVPEPMSSRFIGFVFLVILTLGIYYWYWKFKHVVKQTELLERQVMLLESSENALPGSSKARSEQVDE
ncbi:MAG: hypothetical protein OXE92_00205 [Bacteroidetes bacterium]|nr:hypothetical protein [Bacteroidota bacterium]